MDVHTQQPVKMLALEQAVVRKDGTVEHLGLVDYWHANPLCRVLFRGETFCRRWRQRLERERARSQRE